MENYFPLLGHHILIKLSLLPLKTHDFSGCQSTHFYIPSMASNEKTKSKYIHFLPKNWIKFELYRPGHNYPPPQKKTRSTPNTCETF